jgi:parallel beta-helix repeat protein
MKKNLLILALLLGSIIAACGGTAPEPTIPPATPDLGATVQAEVQTAMASRPEPTPLPTYTPYPTYTHPPEPTNTFPPEPSATPEPTLTHTPTPPGPTPTLDPAAASKPTALPPPNIPSGIARALSSTLKGEFAEDTLLTLDHSPYVVEGDIKVPENITLIIEPGVILKFNKHGNLHVHGVLKCQGLPEQPIVFTSIKDDLGEDTNQDGSASSPSPGDWAGLNFQDSSVDAENVVEFTEFHYGGLDSWSYKDHQVGVISMSGASPTVANSRFLNNLWYALSADLQSFPALRGNDMEGNGGNGLEVRGGELKIVTAAGYHWSNTDIVYSITGDATIREGVALIIDPGVIVKLGSRGGLSVSGVLRLEGTEKQPIFFTSIRDDTVGGDTNGDGMASAPEAGDWAGIHFNDSSVDGNCLVQYATFKYGGLDSWSYKDHQIGVIRMEGASPTIQNSAFADNLWYALSADVHSFPVLSNNSYLDNGGNGLEIRGGTLSVEQAKGYRWSNTDIVYALTGDVVINNGIALSIDPGVTVKLGSRVGIYVDGALRVEGTADLPVVFTSLRDDSEGGDTNGDASASVPAPGDWAGIRFQDASVDANCLVQHAILRYGGLDSWSYRDHAVGLVNMWSASPTITDCEMSYSSFYGLWLSADSAPKLEGNTLGHNAEGDVYQEK